MLEKIKIKLQGMRLEEKLKLKENLLPSSRIAVGIVIGVMFVLGVVQIVQGFIDTRNYRAEFIHLIKEKTGKNVSIKGKISVSLLPTPVIYIPAVELRDTESKIPLPSLTVDMVRLDVPFAALFSDHPRITSIKLQQPILELERAQDNIIHWDWLNGALFKTLVTATDAQSLDISGGTIIYHDSRSGRDIQIENLRLSAESGKTLGAKGSFTAYGHNLDFSFNTSALPVTGKGTPFTAELSAGSRNTLRLQGDLDVSKDEPKISGKFGLNVQNLMEWVNAKAVESSEPLALITNQFTKKVEEKKSPVSLTMSGDWHQDGPALELNNIKLQGIDSQGAGKIALAWKGWQPAFTCEMNFSTLDYATWQTFLTAAFVTKTHPQYADNGDQADNPLPRDTQATINITANQISIGTQIWKNIKLSAVLADASLTVNRFNVDLPGESSLTLFGIISQAATSGGMRFEGSMETAGKSLRQSLTLLDASAGNLPETGFGAFSVHSNIFVSSEQVRLSEANVKLQDLTLTGGLVAYFDARPRVEADVKLKSINFDYFRDVWREQQKKANDKDASLKPEAGINFKWLNKLQTSVDFKVNVNGFTFMERKGDSASFRVFAKEGEFGLYDVRLNYPEETMEGSFNINVKAAQPLINVILNADTVDLGYFINTAPEPPETNPTPAAARKTWSEAIIDTSWLEGYNGAFDISVDKLIYGKIKVNRLKLQAKLDNRVVILQNLTFDYWQGRCSILGSMYGGEVPGISISFMLYDIEFLDMLKDLAGRDNITGKGSISGTLGTSGINALSWVSQADAKIVLAGRGVNVTGLNLQGVIDSVAISRTAADVFNNVNQALINGTTELSVDGNINVKNGILKTPGITLRAGAIIGDLVGDIRLVPWTMDLSTLFQFPVITSETIPTMTVQISGPIDSPSLRTDTSSLEAYVAKRIISQ